MADTHQTEQDESPVIQRIFHHADGEQSGRARKDTVAITFKCQNGATGTVDMAKVFGGTLPPPSVGRAAAAFGVSTTIGNAGNTAGADDKKARGLKREDDPDPEIVFNALMSRLEKVVPPDGTEGEWTTARETGPRTSLMLEAIVAYRTAKGRPVNDEVLAKYRASLRDIDYVKRTMADPDFRVIYEKMRVEKTLSSIKADGKSEGSLLD